MMNIFAATSDYIPADAKDDFQKRQKTFGRMLSRFSEAPIPYSDREVFRAITFGSFDRPEDVQIFKIEKWDDHAVITAKLMNGNKKDPAILVHKRMVDLAVWREFESMTDEYFLSRPVILDSNLAVTDGSTTVFEGRLSNRYHYVERHVIGSTDPDLVKLTTFLFQAVGDIYSVNCKKHTREE